MVPSPTSAVRVPRGEVPPFRIPNRNAELHSAVSRICNPQACKLARCFGPTNGLPNTIRRYSRVQLYVRERGPDPITANPHSPLTPYGATILSVKDE